MRSLPSGLLLPALAVILDRSALGAVALDNSTVAGYPNDYVRSTTFNHSVGTGPDRYLVVVVEPAYGAVVRTVTYGGLPLTLIDGATSASTSDGTRVEFWGLANPRSGSGQVAVAFAQNVQELPLAAAVSYTGVDPLTPLGSGARAQGGGPVVALSAPAAAGDLLLGAVSVFSGRMRVPQVTGTLPAQKALWNSDDGFDDTAAGAHSSAAATAVSLSWSLVSQQEWIALGVLLKASVSSSPEDAGAPPDASPPPPDASPAPPDARAPPADGLAPLADAVGPAVDAPVADSLPQAGGASEAGRPVRPGTPSDALEVAVDVRTPDRGSDAPPARVDAQLRVGCACALAAHRARRPLDGGAALSLLALLAIARRARHRRRLAAWRGLGGPAEVRCHSRRRGSSIVALAGEPEPDTSTEPATGHFYRA